MLELSSFYRELVIKYVMAKIDSQSEATASDIAKRIMFLWRTMGKASVETSQALLTALLPVEPFH